MQCKHLTLHGWLEKHCASAATPTVVNNDSPSEKPSLTTHPTKEVITPAQIDLCGMWGVIRRKMAALIKKKHRKYVKPQVDPITQNPPEEEFKGLVSSPCRTLYTEGV